MTDIIYSAYNAAPAGLPQDSEAEGQWYAALRSDPRIDGLELPVIRGQLHPHGIDRLASLLHRGWSNTVSAMSMTLVAKNTDQGYGLASKDREGRQRALSDIALARTETLLLQERLGPASVRAFALQSAPRADHSSLSAFTDSFRQIASWDWGHIELLVEHSDALVPGQKPQKGYLTLEEEMEAVHEATNPEGPRIRHLVNWGRSAIEGRCARTPLEHIEKLADGLGAFAFSGAAPVATDRSVEWEDVHLGLAADEPGSLLDSDGIRRLLTKLPENLSYLGVKTGAPVGSRGAERLQLGLSMLDILCTESGTSQSSLVTSA